MENMQGLRKDPSNRSYGVSKEQGTEQDDQVKVLKLSGFPAFNVVYTNIFCINRPISNVAPSARKQENPTIQHGKLNNQIWWCWRRRPCEALGGQGGQ